MRCAAKGLPQLLKVQNRGDTEGSSQARQNPMDWPVDAPADSPVHGAVNAQVDGPGGPGNSGGNSRGNTGGKLRKRGRKYRMKCPASRDMGDNQSVYVTLGHVAFAKPPPSNSDVSRAPSRT